MYLDLAMAYLKEHKHEILELEGERFLLDWHTIADRLFENK